MTERLGNLLRRGADSVAPPPLDLDGLVAEASRRRRRRRYIVIATATAAVCAVVLGAVLAAGTGGSKTEGPSPAGTPSPSFSIGVDAEGSRPLVYAEGRTVHVGDQVIDAAEPVAFIAPTDDGAVYEATLDGTLWFTDGATTEAIGTSGYTAAPTAHSGVVVTGSSGSLVVWADLAHGRPGIGSEFVVYDTSRREEVARIPFPERGRAAYVEYVGESEVWYGADGGTDRQLYRFDETSGSTTPLHRSDLHAVLDTDRRTFTAVASDGRMVHGQPSFDVIGSQLVAGIHDDVDDDATPVTLADGSELRLQLPTGYVGPWPADEDPALAVSQWLDDDHVVLWADDGGGDLPAKSGDLLVCRLPDGVCRVTVPRTSQPYVAPYLS